MALFGGMEMRKIALVGGLLSALGIGVAFAAAPPVDPLSRLSPGLRAELDRLPAAKREPIKTMIRNITAGVIKQHEDDQKKDPKAPATRDAHPKHHGCVTAEFKIREDLATTHPDLAVGVFDVKKTGRTKFPAWIRFSNGAQREDDTKGDGRGMAMKLMGVPGDKLLEDEKETQDFLMINHPQFFVHTLEDYLDFQKAMSGGNPIVGLAEYTFPKPRGLNPLNWHAPRLAEAKVLAGLQGDKTLNPLNPYRGAYYSMVPVKLGNTPMKYAAAPCRGQRFVTAKGAGKDRLRIAMSRQLDPRAERGPVCFEFMVQKQTDARSMPVDNPVVRWSEKRSPFVPVARITIPPQAFESKEQMKFCEDIALTPWHAIAEHEPLGDIQLARKFVYQAISELRHERNDAKHVEPRP